jgi:cold shock protein
LEKADMLENSEDGKFYYGVVKWFSTEKGFGFISVGERDVFARYTSIISQDFKTLSKGQEVKFIITPGERGPEANNIMVVG